LFHSFFFLSFFLSNTNYRHMVNHWMIEQNPLSSLASTRSSPFLPVICVRMFRFVSFRFVIFIEREWSLVSMIVYRRCHCMGKIVPFRSRSTNGGNYCHHDIIRSWQMIYAVTV
jgi:hypothetical protein